MTVAYGGCGKYWANNIRFDVSPSPLIFFIKYSFKKSVWTE